MAGVKRVSIAVILLPLWALEGLFCLGIKGLDWLLRDEFVSD